MECLELREIEGEHFKVRIESECGPKFFQGFKLSGMLDGDGSSLRFAPQVSLSARKVAV